MTVSRDGQRGGVGTRRVSAIRRHSLLFALALVAFGLAEVAMFAVQRGAQRWQEHSRQVARVARVALSLALRRDDAVTRMLLVPGVAGAAQPLADRARLDSSLDSLVALTADNPEQQGRARAISRALRAWQAGFMDSVQVGALAPAEAERRDADLFGAVQVAFGEFLTAEDVLYDDRAGQARLAGLLALLGMIVPSGLLAGLVVASGRRFAGTAEQLADQQLQLEEQAVELEQQVQELEVANTELAESMELERQARDRAEQESRERRRTAALLNAALQSSPVAMSLLDDQLRYRMVNDATCQVTGFSAPQLIGHSLREMNPGFGVDTEQALRHVLATMEPLRNLAMQRPGNGPGKARQMLISAFPARLPDDSIGLGVTAVDVTEQRELLEQFHHAQKLEAVGRLAAGIAHDFNNLLTVVRSYCDLALLEMPDGAPGREEIREIRAAGERAAALSRQMVAMSRKQAIIPRALAVGEAVREMESMLQRVTGDTVAMRVELDEPLGIVYIDPTHLEQVLMNLVINAVDAMPGGGEIVLTAGNVNVSEAEAARLLGLKAGTHVTLQVRDTGTGIDPDTLRRVFDPFFTTKEPGKGTGLGLSTVYGIVRDAGGHVRVDSEVGKGTTFVIYLPAEIGDQTAPERHEVRVEAPRAVGDETILVVEDEDALRGMLVRILSRRGYTVLQAAHGGEAMRVSVEFEGKIDLVLSDFHMPGMHGRDLIDRLHEQRPDLRVVFMSGSSAASEDAKERGAGPHPFIPKPFTVEDLARKVRQALDA